MAKRRPSTIEQHQEAAQLVRQLEVLADQIMCGPWFGKIRFYFLRTRVKDYVDYLKRDLRMIFARDYRREHNPYGWVRRDMRGAKGMTPEEVADACLKIQLLARQVTRILGRPSGSTEMLVAATGDMTRAALELSPESAMTV